VISIDRKPGGALLHPQPAPVDLSAFVPSPRSEMHPRAIADPDEPLDVRLHAPTPDAVIVRVLGPLDGRTCATLVLRVRQQLHRAPHVILDLSSVTWMDLRVARELRALRAMAADHGTHLHVAAENERVVEGLRLIGLGGHVVPGTADAVLACLARGNG
jgi:anti-anti-sigma regulatory factor